MTYNRNICLLSVTYYVGIAFKMYLWQCIAQIFMNAALFCLCLCYSSSVSSWINALLFLQVQIWQHLCSVRRSGQEQDVSADGTWPLSLDLSNKAVLSGSGQGQAHKSAVLQTTAPFSDLFAQVYFEDMLYGCGAQKLFPHCLFWD